MRKVGFVTYNTLPEFENGWTMNADGSRSALIVQDTNGQGALKDGQRTRTTQEIRDRISKSWDDLETFLPQLDCLVIYVGTNGSEDAIKRAATKMPVERLVFIGCTCNLERKLEAVRSAGLDGARRFLCECGGHRTMTTMIRSFLDQGDLLV